MPKPSSPWWWDLSTREFAALDWDTIVAIQPVAAVEQHGPHLPVRVDAAINAGIIARAVALMPRDAGVLVLPALPVGTSAEHQAFPGTLSLAPETLARVWTEIAVSVHRAGGRRILFFNSHGGQPQVADLVCRDLRVRLQMLAVSCAWWQLADTGDLFAAQERRHGIHAGEIETSLMLHLDPERVAMQEAKDFVSRAAAMEASGALLTPEAGVGFAWQTQDLNPSGACGNAAAADAARGQEVIERAARGLVRLVHEMTEFPLGVFGEPTAYQRS